MRKTVKSSQTEKEREREREAGDMSNCSMKSVIWVGLHMEGGWALNCEIFLCQHSGISVCQTKWDELACDHPALWPNDGWKRRSGNGCHSCGLSGSVTWNVLSFRMDSASCVLIHLLWGHKDSRERWKRRKEEEEEDGEGVNITCKPAGATV